MSETEISSDDGYISPLRTMISETHEIYLELTSVGFPDAVATQIIAHILSDAVASRADYDDEDEDEDDEEGPDDETDQGFAL